MSLESVSRISDLTGLDRRTIKARIDFLVPIVEGRSHLYETREVLPVLYGQDDGVIYDLTEERARLAHHQANNEALKERAARGELIPAEMVIKHGAAMVAAVRAKILAAHNKIRNRFADLSPGAIDEMQNILTEALAELAADGIPEEIRKHIRGYIRRMDTAAEPDD